MFVEFFGDWRHCGMNRMERSIAYSDFARAIACLTEYIALASSQRRALDGMLGEQRPVQIRLGSI